MEKISYDIIPARLYDVEELAGNDIIILGQIKSLADGNNGVCVAGNEYFAKKLKITENGVQKILAKLEKLNFITRRIIRFDGNKSLREIRLLPEIDNLWPAKNTQKIQTNAKQIDFSRLGNQKKTEKLSAVAF